VNATAAAAFVPIADAKSRLESLPWGLCDPVFAYLESGKPTGVWSYAWDGTARNAREHAPARTGSTRALTLTAGKPVRMSR
jgi:hypothetical protein